ncbi:MAG: ABC transporter permease [Oscillospiraceae bacterium]|nr:ABC transporter permease [Oscillospiraceae bacterium]
MINTIKELYNYRVMLYSLVKKDLSTRYRGSVLGFLWTFLNPLLMMFVYYFVFSKIHRIGSADPNESYLMFMFVAMLPWIFFSSSLTGCTSCITAGGGLLKKIYFPRMILPLSGAVSNLMNYIFSLAILIPSLLITGTSFNLNLLYFPLVLLILFMMVLGFCFLFSALNVYLRDLEHIVNILIMGWFFLTPVLYELSVQTEMSSKIRLVMMMNPVAPIVMSFREILLRGNPPDFSWLSYSAVFAVVILLIGGVLFSKLQKYFVEEI